MIWKRTFLRIGVAIGSASLLAVLLGGVCLSVGVQAQALGPPPPPEKAIPDYPLPPPALPRPANANIPADLSVLYISCTPRYQRYCLDYSSGSPELCQGSGHEKRFPDPGEVVTLTARVANQGGVGAAATTYTWLWDGEAQAWGIVPALAPGETVDLVWTWPWQSAPHTITLDIAATEDELTDANNRLDHRSDAHYLEVLVHPYFVDAFAERLNGVGSYSFHDWLQAQFRQMNQRLAQAIYPELPGGIGDRIRIDVITETVEVGGDAVSSTLAYDGRWTFRPEKDYKRTPENEALASAQHYAQTFAAGIDWGLIHELAHQLGVIDLYQLNVSSSAGNLVSDREGLPLLSGFYWRYPGLMGGGDARPYDGTHFSDHTAQALNTNTGFRRGYFGEYLYDLPQEIWLEVLDKRGGGVGSARIELYQSERNVVEAEPVFVGETNVSGLILLPNRPVSSTLTTATGHTLRANPYGSIDVVGRNGQMLIRVLKGDQEYFRWLPITEMNKAAWRGQRIITDTIATHFPPDAGAPPQAPSGLSLRTTGSQAVLQWPPVQGAVSYNIYGGTWPGYYPFDLLAEGVSGTTYIAALDGTSRFAVTAVASDGGESGFSDIARAELLFSPGGLVWRPQSTFSPAGELWVMDQHSGAILLQLPPECADGGCAPRWVGRVGSEHHGLVGVVDAAPGPGKMVGAAQSGADRVWLFDERQRLFNWFGRINDLPSVLENPGGLALGGEPFSVDSPHRRPDPGASLLLPFDGDLLDPDGATPILSAGLAFTEGRFGQALLVRAGDRLWYAAGDFDARRGGVEFWFRPDWPGASRERHVLLEIGDPAREPEDEQRSYRLRLAHEAGGLYVWVTDFEDIDKAAWAEVADWQAGTWHHIAATWEEGRLSLFVDGRLAWGEALPFPIAGEPSVIAVGGTLAGEDAAAGAFDAFRLSDYPRLGNSEEVRVLVSERQMAEIKVLDLLGNRLSTWTPDDDGLHGFGQLAMGPEGRVWVTDEEVVDVGELLFDGEALVWQRWLELPLRRGPLALAVSDEGWLAADDRAGVLVLDPDRPERSRRWTAPNDGSAGDFVWPTTLAFGPEGDLAVSDAGTREIRYIYGAIPQPRQFFSFILK